MSAAAASARSKHTAAVNTPMLSASSGISAQSLNTQTDTLAPIGALCGYVTC